jgi:hypothetical protein
MYGGNEVKNVHAMVSTANWGFLTKKMHIRVAHFFIEKINKFIDVFSGVTVAAREVSTNLVIEFLKSCHMSAWVPEN